MSIDQFAKLPPHSIDAEQCLIASLAICDGDKRAFSETLSIVGREDFYQPDHQLFFDVICGLHKDGKSVDGITIVETLKAKGIYEEVGGVKYLAEMFNRVPSWAHYAHYAKIIRNKAMLRSAVSMANDMIRRAYQPQETADESAEEILTEFSSRAAKIAAGGKSTEVHKLGDAAKIVAARRNLPQSERSIYIATGIYDLDQKIGGMPRGGKTIIGGKPGMGKSALLKQILRNIAGQGITVGLITIEEKAVKIAVNAISSESGVRNNRIAHGTASMEEWDMIETAVDILDGLPYFIVDSARKITKIVAMAGVLASQYGCKVIGVDHLHIIDGCGGDNRNLEITQISAALKWCWKDLDVAGIEAAQLNRAGGRERPTLSNLRESGSLEQDGDVILMLHREDYYRKIDGSGEAIDEILEVIVAKNKDNASAIVPLHFDESVQRIVSKSERPINPRDFEGAFE